MLSWKPSDHCLRKTAWFNLHEWMAFVSAGDEEIHTSNVNAHTKTSLYERISQIQLHTANFWMGKCDDSTLLSWNSKTELLIKTFLHSTVCSFVLQLIHYNATLCSSCCRESFLGHTLLTVSIALYYFTIVTWKWLLHFCKPCLVLSLNPHDRINDISRAKTRTFNVKYNDTTLFSANACTVATVF